METSSEKPYRPDDALDAIRGLVRDREPGEVFEKEPPRGRRLRTER